MSSTSQTPSPCAKPVTPRSFKVRLRVLTPIHIGSGEKLNRLDYFIDENGKFCRVDMDGLFRDPDFAGQLDKFLEAAPSGQPIDDLLGKSGPHRKHVLYRIPVHDSAINRRENEVSAFIKSAGRVYIPGSSLKGAILSALCWDTLSGLDRDAAKRVLLGWQETDSNGWQRLRRDDPLDVTLRALGGNGRFARWLAVSDSLEMKPPKECLQLVLAESRKGQPRTPCPKAKSRSEGAIPILQEVVKPGIEFTCLLSPVPELGLTIEKLLQTVNSFYHEVAKSDQSVLPDRGLRLPQAGLVRVGSASGFFATSLLLVARKHGLEERYLESLSTRRHQVAAPRTRKRVGAGNIPLGWAQLEVVT